MAAENDNIKKLSEGLDNLNFIIDDISKQIQTNLNKQLAVTSESLNDIVEGFSRGENQTRKITSAIQKAVVENRKLGLDQTRFQTQLLEKEKELSKGYSTKLQREKDTLLTKIKDNLLQQQLNESLLEYLRTASIIAENENNITKEKEKQNSITTAIGSALEKNLGFTTSNIKEYLTLTGIMTFLIKSALQANTQVVELGKALGTSSEKYRENLADVARNSSNINITTANLVEAFNQISSSTGLAYQYTADQLETQVKLTKQVGLQAEEAAQIQRLGVLNNQTSEETYKLFVRGLVATRNQLKVGINFKATLAEAVKVSGQLAANLGFNPERIAKAIVTAKAFGMTLEQVAKSGESLLNFETSLENELKAELLTGRQLNLERARAAALMGDQVTLAEELAKNVGTAANFSKMNVLQQRSLAESVGMTTDELSETLRKREEAIKQGKSLAQITEEEATAAIERQDIQTKFNAAVLKLQDFFGNLVAGPLGQFIDILTKSLDVITAISAVFGTIYAINKGIALIEGIKYGYAVGSRAVEAGKNSILIARQVLLNGELAKYIGIATASVISGNPLALAGLIAAAGVGALVYSQMDDGIIGPGGETIVSGPKGSIKLNKDDSIVAGTNLFNKEINNQTISPSLDLTPMIAAINDVKKAINELEKRPMKLYIDSKEISNAQMKNSLLFA